MYVTASQTEDYASSEAPEGPNKKRSPRSGERPKTNRDLPYWDIFGNTEDRKL